MYAIRTQFCQVGGVISRDQGAQWWNEDRGWTPASDEATEYETAEQATAAIPVDRGAAVVVER